MKNKLLILIILLVVLSGGYSVVQNIVGNDVDKNGCKGSAGYTFSKVKNQCIRIFESGIRLDPQGAVADKTTSAFAVFESIDEDAQVEIFLPTSTDSILLNKVGTNTAGTWTNNIYTLSQWKGMYSLEDSKEKLLYQGMIQIPESN